MTSRDRAKLADDRRVVSVRHGPFAEAIYPGGQSEDPASPWYANLVGDWWAGQIPADAGRCDRPSRRERRLGAATVTTEFKRLGKSGAYRLGQLRAQGISSSGRLLRSARSSSGLTTAGRRLAWLLGLLVGALIIMATALRWLVVHPVRRRGAGWPGELDRCLAHARRRARGRDDGRARLGCAVVVVVLRGQPYGAVARVIAALLGLPGYAAVGMAVTVLVAVVQALAGYWLGRAVTPRPAED